LFTFSLCRYVDIWSERVIKTTLFRTFRHDGGSRKTMKDLGTLKHGATMVLLAVLLTGCASQKGSPLLEVEMTGEARQLSQSYQLMKVLARRGVEQRNGLINYTNFTGQCGGMIFSAHRGFVNEPENSVTAIRMALLNGAAEIEIDVMLIRDGTWVLHHDKQTGRATGRTDGDRVSVRSLNDKTRKQVRHRDMSTGYLTNYRIPTLDEAIAVFRAYRRPHQVLNIEVKGVYSKSSLQMFEYFLFEQLPAGTYYFSSSETSTLNALRALNEDVRLNLIQKPNKRSLEEARDTYKQASETDPYYVKNQDVIGNWAQRGLKRYRRQTYMDSRTFYNIAKYIGGGKIDLTVDVRDYAPAAKRLSYMAKQFGMRIGTYSINGQEYHESVLVRANDRPDIVQVDDTVYGFCKRFITPSRDNTAVAFTGLAAQVDALPDDLDLEQLEGIESLLSQRLYPSVNDSIRPIDYQQTKHLTAPKRASRQETEAADRAAPAPLRIKINKGK
jgi:glycerophosphoryl diester phosphodiesterase